MAVTVTRAAQKFAGLLKYQTNPVACKRAPAIGVQENPKVATKKKSRKPRSAAQKAATAKMLAALKANKSGKKTSKKKRKAGKARRKTNTMAARKRNPAKRRRNPARAATTVARVANPRRRKRRKARRNPVAAAATPRKKNPRRKRNSWSEKKVATRVWKAPKHAKAARKGHRRRKSNPAVTGTLTRQLLGHSSATNARLANPIANPVSMRSITGLAVTGAGLGFGLVVSELVDRYVATRTPAPQADGSGGKHPWYGRNAAIAYQRRPDGVRLAVQGGGAVVALMLTGMTRKMPIVPFLAAGTTLGFAANLFQKLFNWYVLPKVLKVKEPGETSLANRLAPLEQDAVQDRVDELMKNYMSITDLAANQQETAGVMSPLNAGGGSILSLGEKGTPVPFVDSGHVGKCDSCGGNGGHYSTCPGANADCGSCGEDASDGAVVVAVPPQMASPGIPIESPFTPPVLTQTPWAAPPVFDDGDEGDNDYVPDGRPQCEYIVQAGDDLHALADEAGINVNDVAAINSGAITDIWRAGSRVILPFELCKMLVRKPKGAAPTATATAARNAPLDVHAAIPQASAVPYSMQTVRGFTDAAAERADDNETRAMGLTAFDMDSE